MTFRDLLAGNEPLIGTIQIADSPMISELIGFAGMDFLVLDQEHGPLSAETSQACCIAATAGGAAPIVRVRDNAVPEIQRALDIGSAGIQVPQIETGEAAEWAVQAARFPPHGSRGLSQYVRAGGYVGQADYAARQNAEVTVLLQVEGERGLNNLEEILAVDGFDAIFLGPYDISSSLGIPGQITDDRVQNRMTEACALAEAAGVTVGTFADTPEQADRWIGAGVDFVELGVALALFGDVLSAHVQALTGS